MESPGPVRAYVGQRSNSVDRVRPLGIEDERGEKMRGKDTLPEPADDWRFGGTLIEGAFFGGAAKPKPVRTLHALRCFFGLRHSAR